MTGPIVECHKCHGEKVLIEAFIKLLLIYAKTSLRLVQRIQFTFLLGGHVDWCDNYIFTSAGGGVNVVQVIHF